MNGALRTRVIQKMNGQGNTFVKNSGWVTTWTIEKVEG